MNNIGLHTEGKETHREACRCKMEIKQWKWLIFVNFK